jgi:RNA polymerase sigma-70 factor (ECF subfamily)
VKRIIVENLTSLRRFAYSLTKDMNDADDLVQVVVERLLNKPIPEGVGPVPWIFRVCKNAWIDEIRSRQIRRPSDSVAAEDIIDIPATSQPELIIEKRDLHQAIDSLSEAYRIVMGLIILAGLSYAETAEILEVPIGTVMSRVSRAREKLAKALGNIG